MNGPTTTQVGTLRHDHAPGETRNFRLTVVHGPEAGASLVIDQRSSETLFIGTSGVCALRLTDRYVSRRHLALRRLEHVLRLVDGSSANGTFVNGVRTVEADLVGGEMLNIGQSALRVEGLSVRANPSPVGPVAFGRAIGSSATMRALFTRCEELARSDVPVMIEGETGTGKDLIAEGIHLASGRRDGPFFVFDGSTLTPATAEVMLFGCEPNRLPSTPEAHVGLLERADGGTLLIDEPALCENRVQRRLARALASGEFRRIGSDVVRRSSVRILVTSSIDLDRAVEDGRLREDLFYRLAGARVELPPLRHRREDIALLTRRFWTEQGGAGECSPVLLARFERRDWPGNVRELENAIALHLATGALDAHAHRVESPEVRERLDPLNEVLGMNLPFPQAKQRMLAEFERAFVTRLLAQHGGNVGRAAAASGIGRRYFQVLNAKYRGG